MIDYKLASSHIKQHEEMVMENALSIEFQERSNNVDKVLGTISVDIGCKMVTKLVF